jgi:hypothetical protein
MENIRTVGQLISELSKFSVDSPLVDIWDSLAVVTLEEVELEDLDIKGCHIEVLDKDDIDEIMEEEYNEEDDFDDNVDIEYGNDNENDEYGIGVDLTDIDEND